MKPYSIYSILAAYCLYFSDSGNIHSKVFSRLSVVYKNKFKNNHIDPWRDGRKMVGVIAPKRLGGMAAKRSGEDRILRRLRKELMVATKENDADKIRKLVNKIRYESI